MNEKKIILFSLISFYLLVTSCNPPSRKIGTDNFFTDTTTIINTIFKRGSINNVTSFNNPNCSYSFYLPNDSLQKYPTLILLDPHAKGSYIISLYQSLAEKYKVILISSNNTRNRQSISDIEQYINCMLFDAKNYLPVDTQKIYIGGFSGMARAIYQIGINSKLYKGIVAIGAGSHEILPWRDSLFCIIQMAGFKDMNFSEVFESNLQLKNVSNLYMSFYYDGEHKWPTDSLMEFAFLNFFGKHNSNEINKFVEKQYKYCQSIPLRDSWKKVLICQSLKSLCQNLKYYRKPFNEINTFLNKFESKNAIKQLQQVLKEENKEKENIVNNFLNKDSVWWTKTISFYKSIKDKKTLSPIDYKDLRLLNYIGLVSYSFCLNALKQNNIALSRKFLKIYQQVEPYNGDMLYFWSVYFAKLKQSSRSLDSLYKAVKLGFSDKTIVQNEPAFFILRDSIRFNDVISKIH